MRSTLCRFAGAAALLLALAAPAAAGTLDKIKASGEIVIGYREASPPFSSVNAAGEPEGYSIDLCQRIVGAVKTELGLAALKTRFVPVTVENRVDKVAGGEVDIECGSTSRTLSREARVDFTLMTFVTGTDMLVRASSPIHNISDLMDRKLALLPGSTNATVMERLIKLRLLNTTIVPVKDHDEGVAAVEDGRADAYASDQILLIGLAMRAKDPSVFHLVREIYSYEPYALMVRQNDASFRLVTDRALASLFGSGEILHIYQRWFGRWSDGPSDLLMALYQMQSLSQ